MNGTGLGHLFLSLSVGPFYCVLWWWKLRMTQSPLYPRGSVWWCVTPLQLQNQEVTHWECQFALVQGALPFLPSATLILNHLRWAARQWLFTLIRSVLLIQFNDIYIALSTMEIVCKCLCKTNRKKRISIRLTKVSATLIFFILAWWMPITCRLPGACMAQLTKLNKGQSSHS